MENYLITGGAGFIGSNFIHYLLAHQAHCRIVNLDLLTYAGNLANLQDVAADPRYIFVKGDINDSRLVTDLLREYQIDYLINFAAESHVDRSLNQPEFFMQTNTQGTLSLLESARQVGLHKFVQISTDEVYGSLGSRGYFSEQSPLKPSSPYSASKAAAEMFVQAYHKTYGLNVNLTRSSNNYGPYQHPEKLVPLLVTRGVQGKDLPIYGSGENIRDWLYVEDNCRAIDLVLHQGRSGEVYNIGGHAERSNNEIASLLVDQLNLSRRQIKHVADRLGHDQRYALDTSKIEDELGWQPRLSFDEGLERTVEWYVAHEEWWQGLL